MGQRRHLQVLDGGGGGASDLPANSAPIVCLKRKKKLRIVAPKLEPLTNYYKRLPELKREAKERQLATLKQNATVRAKMPEREKQRSRDKAAAIVGANRIVNSN